MNSQQLEEEDVAFGEAQAAQVAQYNSKQYDRIRVIGKGSFGTAIVHRRRADCSLVVLKEIDLRRFKCEQEKLAAINEARIMSKLSHVNIIKYYNAYATDTKLIIEMEYASIGTLAAYLSFQIQPLEEQEILIIFRQIVSGLHYLHSKNIIHLDLKMANIFVTLDGLVKIGDFGIAQFMHSNKDNPSASETAAKRLELKEDAGKNMTNSHLGTLAYSSPERCLGLQTDFKSDIWSLGCILYELITSRALFAASNLPELILSITQIRYDPIKRKVAPALKETFRQMIARDPRLRPSARELLLITRELLSDTRLECNKMLNKRQNRRFDLSTEVALLAASNQDDINQINYLHSLVYQVRLDSKNIHVDRVNLPQSKRIKEISKGKSHYLVLTYDNIVYGWGSKNHGQLGACGLTSSAGSKPKITRSARNSVEVKDLLFHLDTSNVPPSLASSTQTILTTTSSTSNKTSSQHLSKQSVMNLLEESQPTTRPFIINELNHRKITQVAAGNNFSVFLSKTGIVMTCGEGSSGCLGRGDTKSCFTPCMVSSLLNSDVVYIGCGPEHVVAVCGNGRAFAWGKSGHGRLGVGIPKPQGAATRAPKYLLLPQPVQIGPEVFIKSVHCGDKSTIFIDSQNRCWACGENRFNKLGLDIKRRFKKTLIVEKSWIPTEVVALSKYRVLSCNIGKNHSTFITSEGKLIVCGQDIDHTYRLKSNIVCARDSHRRISFDLQPNRRRQFHRDFGPKQQLKDGNQVQLTRTVSCKQLSQSAIFNNQLKSFKRSAESVCRRAPEDQKRYSRYKLSKHERHQIDSYVRKSRASKKMPFEFVIGVSCTSKFTLALTNDNRIYFWGTRSYSKEEGATCLALTGSRLGKRGRIVQEKSVEPQLVAGCSDECFIKIGATNNSLMSNIQALGSDQPIIHAQDPRLMAKSLADLWILDYEPTVGYFTKSSLHSSSSSLSSSSSYSSCSHCCLESQNSSSCSLCPSQLVECNCEEQDGFLSETPSCVEGCNLFQGVNCMKHDAILEPQPIVSLYVPSMFNNNGCSLHLVDVFCFDENRFYLVLDTTIKLQQFNSSRSKSSLTANGGYSTFTSQRSTPRKRLNSLTGAPNVAAQSRPNQMSSAHDIHEASLGEQMKTVASSVGEPKEAEGELEQVVPDPARAEDDCTGARGERIQSMLLAESECECGAGADKSVGSIRDNNNNNLDNHSATTTNSSQGELSLEEPRSLSTFVTSVNNHIVVGENLRPINTLEQEQPLSFNQFAKSGQPTNLGAQSNSPLRNQVIERRVRRITSKSDSTTPTGNDNDETSSMPSWVRNEYIQQQQSGQRLQDDRQFESARFVLESSETEDTCVSEVSISSTISAPSETSSVCSESSCKSAISCRSLPCAEQKSCRTLDADASSIRLSCAYLLEAGQLEPVETREELADEGMGAVLLAEGSPKAGRPLPLSRSQPDISETEAGKACNRRASIVGARQVGVGEGNLLDCNVYKVSNSIKYQSSNPESTLSSRSNSHNPLIRTCSSVRSDLTPQDVEGAAPFQLQTPAGKLPIMSPEDAAFLWSRLDSDTSYQHKPSANLHHPANFRQLGNVNRKLTLCQSTHQLHLNKNNKNGSSSSLASLRKSLVKLFC